LFIVAPDNPNLKRAANQRLDFAMASSAVERPQPSVWAVAFATAIISGLAGYFLGQASSIGVFANQPSSSSSAAQPGAKDQDDTEPDESEEDGDEDDDQEIKSFANYNEECKLVLVVRTDLGMTKGVCDLVPAMLHL